MTLQASSEAPVFTVRARFFLLAGFAVLIMLRLPKAVWQGRFQAEEGTIFFAYAWHRPAWLALWRSFAGYLNLAANASTLLAARLVKAGILSLESAPHLTMGIALAFQVLPAVFLLWGRGAWLRSRWAVIASLLMIVVAPSSEEAWLNVMHIQYQLALCCALILALDCPHRRSMWSLQGFVLVLGPLCGPGAILLAPLFALRVLLERSLGRLVQAGLLAFGSLAQVLVFFTSSPVRGHFLDPATLCAVLLIRLGVAPFGGQILGWFVGVETFKAYQVHGLLWWLIAGSGMLFCAGLLLLAWCYRTQPAAWLIIAGLALAGASFGGAGITLNAVWSFTPLALERYNFLPLCLLGISLISLAQGETGKRQGLLLGLCVIVLSLATVGYPHPIASIRTGPDWRREVAFWRDDHHYALHVWQPGWTVDLSDRDAACHSFGTASAITDPSYCESAWDHHVSLQSN